MVWTIFRVNHTFTSVTYAYIVSHDMTTARLNVSVMNILFAANITNGNTLAYIYTLSNGTF
jgi:hypothetical protein